MKRSRLLGPMVLALAGLLLAGLVYRHHQTELQRRLEYHQAELGIAFGTLVDSYRQVVAALFRQGVDRPEIVDLVAQANSADEPARRRLRGRLYRELYPLYRLLREQDIRVLQLVLRDGSSLLRFNRPDLFDDQIAADRPLLEEVLQTGKPRQAFENGRVYPGFRYGFPLYQDGEVVGVADFSASFDALHRILIERKPAEGAFKQLLIRRDLMEEVAHPSSLGLFMTSPVHPDYVTEKHGEALRHIVWAPELPPYLEELNGALAGNPAVRQVIGSGRGGGGFECLKDERCFAISMMPVTDSRNRPAAYILSSTPSDDYREVTNESLAAFLIAALLLAGGGAAMRRWLVSRQRLETISHNMAEGLYVMDPNGRVVFVNAAASDLLGYSPQELKGQVAHDLFHAHSGDIAVERDKCPIRCVPLEGGTYVGENENFRCRDGSLMRVQVTSSPLREHGEISGSVVLFRDISSEYQARIRMQQADSALHNLAEAVLVTNSHGEIQAVNPAFASITGYSESEVLGKNPSLLSSGRHDRAFYQQLWRGLETNGSWSGEIWNRRKTGEVYPEWLSISAINDDQGELVSYVSVFSDITELRNKEQKLRELAFHDQLTGLPNRASFNDLFQHAVQLAKRRKGRLALLYLDIDQFKRVNDTLGHLVGDQLLVAVGRRLRDTVRSEDVVARLGGDEFTILLDDISTGNAPARVAHKLLDALGEPLELEHRRLHLTASIGIALFPQDGSTSVDLMKNADAAMYLAKQSGRGDYRYFTASMAREAEERFALENELRVALNEEQLLLHFQPKVELKTGRIAGLEALLRWQHPVRGVVGPNRFLDTAAEAGLMPDITEWVVRHAVRQWAAWKDLGLDPGKVAINLDDQTFRAPDAASRLARWIRLEGAEPNEVELEIVESVIVQRNLATPPWHSLVEAGFDLSIDDFGTGESSLFRLKHLPVRTLKVDKAFVDEIDKDEKDRTVMSAIIRMAKSLGKEVLAEGVERDSQLSILEELGCDLVQGYLLGRPVPAEQITRLLNHREAV